MAQRALGAGTVVPRKRALFGLLDARRLGVGVGQGVRLADLHHLHPRLPARPGVLPDGQPHGRPRRPGLVADQPLPADERVAALPGAGRRGDPVQNSPAELALPAPRTDGSVLQVGTQILYIGGTDGKTAQSTVYVAKTVGTGNFDKWTEGPALPDAARRRQRRLCRRQHLRHRWHRCLRRADRQGLRAEPRQPDRRARPVGDRRHPQAPRGSRRRRRSRSPPTALLLIGGRNTAGPVDTTLKTRLDFEGRARARGRPNSRSIKPQNDATAVAGRRLPVAVRRQRRQRPDRHGPARCVRGRRGRGPAREPERGQASSAGTSTPSANLPVARTNASGWGANGAIYLAGGNDGIRRRRRELYWAVPTTTGDLPEWKHLTSATCPCRPRRRPRRRQRTRRDPRRRHDRIDGAGRDRASGRTPPPATVLPARPGRRDRPGPQDQGRDRPAARLPQRGRRRHGRLRPADPDRLGVRPQGADAGALRAGSSGGAAAHRPAWASAGRELAFARLDRAASDRQAGPLPGVHPARHVDDVGPSGPDQVAGHGRRSAAHGDRPRAAAGRPAGRRSGS